MVNQKSVSVAWQMVFTLIPFVWIYAFYRIEKLIFGVLLAIGTAAVIGSITMVLPEPYGVALTWPISIIIPIYFIRKWSIEWNSKF